MSSKTAFDEDAALTDAKRKAASSGVPQPVKNRAGKVIYYVGTQGEVVPSAIAEERRRSAQSAPAPSRIIPQKAHTKQDLVDASKQLAAPPAVKQTAAGRERAAEVASANQGYVWVDGKVRKITGVDGNGAWTYALDGVQQKAKYTPPNAYDALDSGQLPDAGTQYLMSQGPANIFTGQQNVNYGPAGSGDHSASANTVSNASNYMTIGNGLTWLVNLSIKDPESYMHMVDNLHKSGYLSDNGYSSAGGGYDSNVGAAFAMAARDVAVLNSSPNAEGASTTLDDYLTKRAAAADAQSKKAKADAYTPVQRSYTDPEELKAQARTAAQSAIGRALTPDEEARLTSHFHSLEAGAYDTIDAAGKAGTSATVTNPSATGQIGAFLDQGNLAQEQANYSVAQYGSALRRLFGLDG